MTLRMLELEFAEPWNRVHGVSDPCAKSGLNPFGKVGRGRKIYCRSNCVGQARNGSKFVKDYLIGEAF